MNWFTGVVLYVLIWWTMLFAVLPSGRVPGPNPMRRADGAVRPIGLVFCWSSS